MNAPQRQKGFSLLEVVIAIGVVSFVLVAILGCYTAGLQTAATCHHQTRAHHLAKSLFSELHSGPFRQASCSGQTFDLSQPGKTSLYATFQEEKGMQISASPPAGNKGYLIRLQYEPVTSEHGAVVGSRVSLAIAVLSQPERLYRYVSIVGNY